MRARVSSPALQRCSTVNLNTGFIWLQFLKENILQFFKAHMRNINILRGSDIKDYHVVSYKHIINGMSLFLISSPRNFLSFEQTLDISFL